MKVVQRCKFKKNQGHIIISLTLYVQSLARNLMVENLDVI